MSNEKLDELCEAWKSQARPPQLCAYDSIVHLHIPMIVSVPCWIRYDYVSGRYEMYFVTRRGNGVHVLELYTEPIVARIIRKYVRWRLGIRFIPSLHIIGRERKSTLPASVQSQYVRG